MSDQSSQGALVRLTIDAAAGTTLVAAFFSWMPTILTMIGATLSIVWFLLQICDHPTVVAYLDRRRERIRTRRLRKLLVRQKIIQAKILAASAVTQAKIEAVKIVERAKTDAVLTQTLDKNLDSFLR